MKRKFILFFILFISSLPAFASAYWIDIKGSGKVNEPVNIELCYGSMDQYGIRRRDTGKELQLTGDFHLYVINTKGIKEELQLKLQKDSWLAIFIPKEEGQYRIIGLNDKHPVVDRSASGGKNILPVDYINADYFAGNKKSSDLKSFQLLDLAVSNDHGKITVKAYLQSKPSKQGTKLRVFNPENWEKELTLDENGEAVFYPTMKGLYIIRQDFNESISGSYQNVSYSSKRHRCNYFLFWE